MPTPRTLLGVVVLGVTVSGLAQCRSSSERKAAPEQAKIKSKKSAASPAVSVASAPSASQAAPPLAEKHSPHPPADTEGCPEGMVRVRGDYCPGVIQTCDKHHDEYRRNKNSATVSERCLKYVEPSRCVVDKRQPMDFCIDRYEYPNELGELPWVLTSWRQAERLCREQGKRLCTEDEFNFACEGPEMLPYVNGYERDPKVCNIDKEYRTPDHTKQLLTYELCLKDATCKAELDRLDQRHAIGSRLSCVSWAGAVDLNGNVNEWVSRRGQEPPSRSGLKGGWWGPVRNRCRPTVRFHKEFDYGYEAGFRCCKGHGPQRVDPRYDQERYKVSPEQVQANSRAKERVRTEQAPRAPAAPASEARPPQARPDSPTPRAASGAPSTAEPAPPVSVPSPLPEPAGPATPLSEPPATLPSSTTPPSPTP